MVGGTTDKELRARIDSARRSALKALALDSTLAAPHVALAGMLVNEHKWREAEREYQKAMAIEPTYPTTYHRYSRLLLSLGRFSEAVPTASKARSLDPLSAIINANVAIVQLCAGNYAAADSAVRTAMELDPNPVIRWVFAVILTAKKDYRVAIAHVDTLQRSDHDITSNGAVLKAYALAQTGDSSAARNLLVQLKRRPKDGDLQAFSGDVWAYIAMLELTLNERDSAASSLISYLREENDLTLVRWPFFESLRNDSRVQAALQDVTHGR
jgi:Tfp pilus assembly protein PilF